MVPDSELLRRYTDEGAEPAFRELVERHVNLVYFAALRRTGNSHLAEEIAQRVFTEVARRAATLRRHPTLTGWLFTTTRYIAAKAMRAEERRRSREQEARFMHEINQAETGVVDHDRLREVVDRALEELNHRDREAILMRYFDGAPFATIAAVLGISEDAARMRLGRALDRLQGALTRRGVTSTAVALGTALAAQGAAAAPGGLAAMVAGSAMAGATLAVGSAGALSVFPLMTTKLLVAAATVVLIGTAVVTWQQQHTIAVLRRELGALRSQTSAVAEARTENVKLQEEKAAAEQDAKAARAEVSRIRAAIAAKRAAATKAVGDAMTEPSAGRRPAPGMISTELMADVGRSTPSAAAQTIAFGLQRGDIKTIASVLALEPADRAKLEEFMRTMPERMRSAYATPEEVIALGMAGSPRPIAAVRQISRRQPDADTEVHEVEWQYENGEVQRSELKFQRDPGGWKQVVASATVDRILTFLRGHP
jgi:RNA polymerase sigma factor (sigma-70 family)